MLETTRIWTGLGMRAASLAAVVLVSACADAPSQPIPAPQPVVQSPPAAPAGPRKGEKRAAKLEEARALLAQAETDIQRARAKRALWQKAWEDLVTARQAVAARESEKAIRHARSASELALLGLEQLAYPPVK